MVHPNLEAWPVTYHISSTTSVVRQLATVSPRCCNAWRVLYKKVGNLEIFILTLSMSMCAVRVQNVLVWCTCCKVFSTVLSHCVYCSSPRWVDGAVSRFSSWSSDSFISTRSASSRTVGCVCCWSSGSVLSCCCTEGEAVCCSCGWPCGSLLSCSLLSLSQSARIWISTGWGGAPKGFVEVAGLWLSVATRTRTMTTTTITTPPPP